MIFVVILKFIESMQSLERYASWFEKLFGFVEKSIEHMKMREMFEYNYESGIL